MKAILRFKFVPYNKQTKNVLKCYLMHNYSTILVLPVEKCLDINGYHQASKLF
jgi:hypothetical protein